MSRKTPCPDPQRRRFLRRSALLLAAGPLALDQLAARPLYAGPPLGVRRLCLRNTHTGECRNLSYWSRGRYLDKGLDAVNHILRDHRTGDVHPIDPRLLDLLHEVAERLETSPDFEVISGYRSARTNELLRREGHAVASRSYHVKGQAVDLRLVGVALPRLRAAALDLRRGGVGYYPASGFVHLDTGPVRSW